MSDSVNSDFDELASRLSADGVSQYGEGESRGLVGKLKKALVPIFIVSSLSLVAGLGAFIVDNNKDMANQEISILETVASNMVQQTKAGESMHDYLKEISDYAREKLDVEVYSDEESLYNEVRKIKENNDNDIIKSLMGVNSSASFAALVTGQSHSGDDGVALFSSQILKIMEGSGMSVSEVATYAAYHEITHNKVDRHLLESKYGRLGDVGVTMISETISDIIGISEVRIKYGEDVSENILKLRDNGFLSGDVHHYTSELLVEVINSSAYKDLMSACSSIDGGSDRFEVLLDGVFNIVDEKSVDVASDWAEQAKEKGGLIRKERELKLLSLAEDFKASGKSIDVPTLSLMKGAGFTVDRFISNLKVLGVGGVKAGVEVYGLRSLAINGLPVEYAVDALGGDPSVVWEVYSENLKGKMDEISLIGKSKGVSI